jgi:hypothetical protein
MSDPHQDDDFTPQEKQARFEATLRGALKTPPHPRLSPGRKNSVTPKKDRSASSDASAATGETDPP